MNSRNHQVIILFDGVCGLCNQSVNWLITKDEKNIFQFTPLQGRFTKELKANSKNFPESDSLMIYLNENIYDKSTAALYIAKKLPIPWKLFYAFIIVPKGFRDIIYDYIAANRFNWFGKSDTCRIPNTKEKHLFID